ncbi:MAG: aromatic-ring-hydroxylating dioxygenase subunit beta [Pseudomonadota bacterium]
MDPRELRELRLEIEDLYCDYATCLDDDELERWPDLFTDECTYKIIPRENFDRGLPLATLRCESRGMLKDRVVAIRQTAVYAPRFMRHLVGPVRIRGMVDGVIEAQASYLVLETRVDEETRIFNTGRYLDKLVRHQGRLVFKERLCVFDSNLVPASLIYPI